MASPLSTAHRSELASFVENGPQALLSDGCGIALLPMQKLLDPWMGAATNVKIVASFPRGSKKVDRSTTPPRARSSFQYVSGATIITIVSTLPVFANYISNDISLVPVISIISTTRLESLVKLPSLFDLSLKPKGALHRLQSNHDRVRTQIQSL